MPSFGYRSLWDAVVLAGLIIFLLLSRRMHIPGGIAVGVFFAVAGCLAIVTGRVAFRHWSVYTGSSARFIGLSYVLVGVWFFTSSARRRRSRPPLEQHAAEKP